MNYWEEKHNKHKKKNNPVEQINIKQYPSAYKRQNDRKSDFFFFLPKETNTLIASNIREEEEEEE